MYKRQDSRRAGKVALQNRANSSKPTLAQNDARHRLNEKHAKARKAPVKLARQEKSKKTDQKTTSRTVDSGNFPPEVTRAATGPPPVAAFSRVSKVITDTAANAIPNAAVNVEVVEEVFTEDILSLSAGESASSSEECTETRTVIELSDVGLKEDSSKKIEDCTTADVVPLPGTSSHDPDNRQDRGRTLYREPFMVLVTLGHRRETLGVLARALSPPGRRGFRRLCREAGLYMQRGESQATCQGQRG